MKTIGVAAGSAALLTLLLILVLFGGEGDKVPVADDSIIIPELGADQEHGIPFTKKPSNQSMPSTIDWKAVAEGLADGRFSSFNNFLEPVGLYQKNGLVESYGLRVEERKAGPIALASHVLHIDGPNAWLIWSPDAVAPSAPRVVRIKLGARLDQGRLSVGVVTTAGQTFRWEERLGPDASDSQEVPIDLDAERASAMLNGRALPLKRIGGVFTAEIPDDLSAAFLEGAIDRWFLHVGGAGPSQSIVVYSVGGAPSSDPVGLSSGRVDGRIMPPPSNEDDRVVTLLTAAGQKFRVPVAADGTFRFEDIPATTPVSVNYMAKGRLRYAARGRWFFLHDAATRLHIPIVPEYSNPDKKSIDPSTIRLPGAVERLSYFRYKPQAKISWPGVPAVQEFFRDMEPLRVPDGPSYQEFDNTTFTNSAGFVDRERFLPNRRGCLRIADVGGSSTVSLQVGVFEKYNILLEEELSRRLGRCVEVISAGRDNGDLGAVYPAVRDYIKAYRPHILLLEHMQLLGLQMQPKLLARLHGWNYEFSPLGHFVISEDGRAMYESEDDSWPLSTVEPDHTAIIANVPFMQTLSVPRDDLTEEGKDAFRRLGAALRVYKELLPGTVIALKTGADQARCYQARTCGPELIWPDGRRGEGGVDHFIHHIEAICDKADVLCITPPNFTPEPGTENLTYRDDGHFTVRGHQWFAGVLADQLEPVLRKIIDGEGQ